MKGKGSVIFGSSNLLHTQQPRKKRGPEPLPSSAAEIPIKHGKTRRVSKKKRLTPFQHQLKDQLRGMEVTPAITFTSDAPDPRLTHLLQEAISKLYHSQKNASDKAAAQGKAFYRPRYKTGLKESLVAIKSGSTRYLLLPTDTQPVPVLQQRIQRLLDAAAKAQIPVLLGLTRAQLGEGLRESKCGAVAVLLPDPALSELEKARALGAESAPAAGEMQ
eukprot:gnl/Dysnectes_brevis/1763_a2011_1956.p1 GENE.gnl/Dysnectes_brevis/1763_a2011_1956~~gnl/Dysnectes_brevis/1763_a2011_1956.p1  ORF type:complete len:218 (+),score=53.99 gnl/Dysnectes_brevis/1763_a2011_1956:442-1095(+)